MKALLAALPLLLSVASAHAQMNCIGSGAIQTCSDPRTGNTYDIQRIGNMTMMQGSNPRTGSRWNETSQTFGNTTMIDGTAANGQRWNSTITRSPGMEQQYGTDSNGRPFFQTCTAAGCF